MNTVEEPAATEAAWLATQGRNLHRLKVAAVLATVSVPGVALLAMLVSEQFVTGDRRYLLAGAIQIALAVPIVYGLFRFVRSDQDRANRVVGALTADLTQAVDVAQSQAHRRELQADRQEFETRLANALDMAEGEPEVIDVIERSFSTILPTAPVELLLADNSHAHLSRMASSATGAPGCGVDSPDHCPAARRAQVQRFDDSDDLDACPKLRGRPGGSVSAVCVPVSIMGRTVGVIHSTGPAGAPGQRGLRARPRHPVQARRRPDRAAAGDGRDPVAGRHRQPDRSAEPSLLRVAGDPGPPRDAVVVGGDGRSGPLQDPQRHLRPRDRRPGAAACSPRCSRGRSAVRTWSAGRVARSSSSP